MGLGTFPVLRDRNLIAAGISREYSGVGTYLHPWFSSVLRQIFQGGEPPDSNYQLREVTRELCRLLRYSIYIAEELVCSRNLPRKYTEIGSSG